MSDSIQVEVWRKAMNDAANKVLDAINHPPRRNEGETLTRYFDRVQDLQTRLITRWKVACEHHAACKAAAQEAHQE